VDLSGLIFVALAVAWAAYLIPKALRHHDDVVRGRSIDRFSHSMRVLARREPVSARTAQLVVTPARPVAAAVVSTKPTASSAGAEEPDVARRLAVRKATRRRRRVLMLLLLGLVGVAAACAAGRIGWPWVAVPAGLLVAWLVACRLMVRKERRPVALLEPDDVEEPEETPVSNAGDGSPEDTAAARDPKLWDPVPVTLPTYVSKPQARRTVRTIDLDSTGVWTSGRTEADAALAREADAAEAAERVRRRVSRKDETGGEAVGS
jgi:hypothetical protein